MTKRAAAGGQSLLISGALKMARGKKAPNNIVNSNSLRHDMTTINNRELQEAIADSHNNSHNNHTMNLSLTHNHLHLNPSESSSSQSSPTRSTSGFASPASSLQQEPIILTNQTMLPSNNNSQTREQHKQQQQQNNLQQINGKNKKLFPQKLWDLINDERYNFCLRWSDDGQLVYLNRDEFEDSYLKTTENQFHTQKAISFVRQMNMYGFRKVDDCYYENDNFKRGCEHLLKNMTRKHPNKTTTVTTSTTSATSATGAVNPATSDSNLPHFLYQKSTSGNQQQHLNLHQPQVSEQFINQFHQQQQQQQAQVIDCTMQQQRPFNSAGVNGAAIDSLVSLLNRSANNSTITSRPMQSMPELHQPIDLQCATRQSASDNTHLQSAASNQNSQQDLNRLIESLAAMSREQQLFNAVQLFMLLLQNSETI